MAGRLEGKIALITGAARGTGRETAALFVAEGAKVVLGDVSREAGEQAAKELGDAAAFEPLDVTSEEDWARVVAAARERFGGLNVLVNNAGVLLLAALEETTLADYERIVGVNQTGTFLGMRAVTPALREAGRGSIVNISSIDGAGAKNGVMAYAASKWAIRGMTRVAALELGRDGIRVNSVCPEAGGPEMRAPYVPEGIDPAATLAFGQRLLSYQREREPIELVRDIARMVLFLASDESLSCTGADYLVDAGSLAGNRVPGTPGA